ncbi:MAG: hypothetical protein BGO78_17730 [Chloroflexi bacterium 44-23]|nr:MAG: hypothetical protein BGO78_17730 [Chloroflexi bacterium 44-23]
MELYIVSDIGGTQIRVAAHDSSTLSCIDQKKIATQRQGQYPIQRLINLIRDISKDHILKAISIGVPGFLDLEKGIILNCPNIPGWVNFPIRQILTEQFNVPIYINNDANLAALGEWKYGIGQGHKNLLYLTISTGIGSGVIINNQLLLGTKGLAGELGHTTLEPNGPLCGCGQYGHLEALASGTAIKAYVEAQIESGRSSTLSGSINFQGNDIFLAARNGDSLAFEAYQRAGKYLGMAIANFLHIFNPSIVILGGGVTQVGDLLFKPTESSLRDHVIRPEYIDMLQLTKSSLGDDVGLQGALAYLVLNNGNQII